MPDKLTPIANDQPAEEDRLGFSRYVEALAGIIVDPGTETPLTLGVFGGWGAGKTSLMLQVQDRVEGGQHAAPAALPTLWFDAWTYNQQDALWRALLLILLDHVGRLVQAKPASDRAEAGTPRRSWARRGRTPGRDPQEAEAECLVERLREALYHDVSWTEQGELRPNWAQAVGAGASLATNVVMAVLGSPLAAAGVATDALQAAREEFAKGEAGSKIGQLVAAFRREELTRYQAQLRSLEQFRENFARLVSLALERSPGQPKKLVVFVDDLDRCTPDKAIQVLEALKLFLDAPGCVFVLGLDAEAIEAAIQTRYRGEVKAREYLEKIIQIPFMLPLITSEPMRDFVRQTAEGLPAGCDEVFAVGLGGNPRQVKRSLNIFLLLWRLVVAQPALQLVITPVRLAKFVVIQHAHTGLYNLLRLQPGALPKLERQFRTAAQPDGKRGPGEETGADALPPELKPFGGDARLGALLSLLDGPEARFEPLNADQMRCFVTLAGQAAPLAVPVAQLARKLFEPQMVRMAGGTYSIGTSAEQVKELVRRYPKWAKEASEKGWFTDEEPQHEVTVGEFEIGRYPVTNAQYAAFVEATGHAAPSHWPEGRLPEELTDHPVVNVRWRDAHDYAAWLAERTGTSYRLPTEAEWEAAARGQKGWQWPWGDDWNPKRANCRPAGPARTTPVGQYSPDGDSPGGAADMAGNVWEWCSSLYKDYPYRADDGREDPQDDGTRVLRGGSWYDNNPAVVRCAYRNRIYPDDWGVTYGFRLARSLR